MDHPLSKHLALYLTALKDERGLQSSTLKLYQLELRHLLSFLVAPDEDSIARIRRRLKSLSPATQWRKLVIWKSFLRSCPQPWNELLLDLKTPKIRQKQPLFLTEQETFQLETICYKTKQISRNRLFVALALHLGLRLSEILALRFEHIEGDWLKIIRKGNKEQRLPLSPTLQTLLQLWKSESLSNDQSWIFCGRGSEPMTARAAQFLVRDLAKLAGIQKKISPHSLRHTFATTLAARGASLAALKELLGHQKITTTERYLHVTPSHLKETLSLLETQKKPRLQTSKTNSLSQNSSVISPGP